MSSLSRRHIKDQFSSSSATQIFSRPKTAQLCSFKKLTEILQGKYMSIQNKTSHTLMPKSSQQRKRSKVISQTQIKHNRQPKNSSINFTKIKNEQKQLPICIDFVNLKKQTNSNLGPRKNFNQKQKPFLPYSQQNDAHYLRSSDQTNREKKVKKPFKKSENISQKQIKNNDQNQMIQSWGNNQQIGLHFSSLFKKSWGL